MKKQIFTLLAVLVLATGTALVAQTGTNTTLPPSQQVDQSGQPETGTGPDVDVDAGRNADDGLVDVEVNRNTDADTEAQGNDTNTWNDQTGVDTTTGSVATDTDTLPDTASNAPLAGLIGLFALAGAFLIRARR